MIKITKEDIGKTVTLRNGNQAVITRFSNSICHPVWLNNNRSYTVDGWLINNLNPNPDDIVKIESTKETKMIKITKDDIGKTVKLGTGELEAILEIVPGDAYPVKTCKHVYTESGRVNIFGASSELDIVKVYSREESMKTPEKEESNEPKLKITKEDVGKKARRRDGSIVTIISYREHKSRKIEYQDDQKEVFQTYENGGYLLVKGDIHTFDILEVIEESMKTPEKQESNDVVPKPELKLSIELAPEFKLTFSIGDQAVTMNLKEAKKFTKNVEFARDLMIDIEDAEGK